MNSTGSRAGGALNVAENVAGTDMAWTSISSAVVVDGFIEVTIADPLAYPAGRKVMLDGFTSDDRANVCDFAIPVPGQPTKFRFIKHPAMVDGATLTGTTLRCTDGRKQAGVLSQTTNSPSYALLAGVANKDVQGVAFGATRKWGAIQTAA